MIYWISSSLFFNKLIFYIYIYTMIHCVHIYWWRNSHQHHTEDSHFWHFISLIENPAAPVNLATITTCQPSRWKVSFVICNLILVCMQLFVISFVSQGSPLFILTEKRIRRKIVTLLFSKEAGVCNKRDYTW